MPLFSDMLTFLRKREGISQQELAEKLKLTRSAVSMYETGKREPDFETLEVFADFFNVNIDTLLGRSDPLPTPFKAIPSCSEDALKLAEDFDKLDTRGQRVVRVVTDEELAYCQKERSMEEVMEPPKVRKMPKATKHGSMVEIKVYDEPAAAGLGNYLDDPDYHIEQYLEHILPSGADFGVRIDGDSMEPKIHNGYTVFVKSMPMIEPGQIGIFVLNGKSYCKKLVVDHERRQTRLVSLNPKYGDIVIQEFDSFKTLGHVLGQWGPGSKEDDFMDW